MSLSFICRNILSVSFLCFFYTAFAVASPAPKPTGKDKSTFTARLINIAATNKEPFRYNASLHNGSGYSQSYEIIGTLPEGWNAVFRTEGSQIAGLRMDSGRTQDIAVEITAAPAAKPGKYVIPVMAVTEKDTLFLHLEAVVTGNYSIELTTPTGRLSDDVTEGRSKEITLTVRNTGSLPLEGLELSAQAPTMWNASFAPGKIDRLEPGKEQNITATLQVPNKTIAGDYLTNFTVRNNNANNNITFRMTVKTSLLAGWVGFLVILLSLAMVYFLIRKYGRR